eukprot:TRINITY_DN7005_c0_g1_i1.p2 TRINITY_DN7005_c0_g1~~TRINITY_DN7005_c0_g1_i1.p2  ORF type:complete len:150 (-),score=4.71 TRINITY_DN7005_c0_g1_i1:624-1073(-)
MSAVSDNVSLLGHSVGNSPSAGSRITALRQQVLDASATVIPDVSPSPRLRPPTDGFAQGSPRPSSRGTSVLSPDERARQWRALQPTLRIQRWWRTLLAQNKRHELTTLRKRQLDIMMRDAAAVVIQSCWRSHAVRKQLRTTQQPHGSTP